MPSRRFAPAGASATETVARRSLRDAVYRPQMATGFAGFARFTRGHQQTALRAFSGGEVRCNQGRLT
jgi:hypothetical protein